MDMVDAGVDRWLVNQITITEHQFNQFNTSSLDDLD